MRVAEPAADIGTSHLASSYFASLRAVNMHPSVTPSTPYPHSHGNKSEDTLTSVTVTLKNMELWAKFCQLGTEMIITKTGRRMFPALEVEVKGLEAEEQYLIYLEMVEVRPGQRLRYEQRGGGWRPASEEEGAVGGPGATTAPAAAVRWLHPESPGSGAHWAQRPVSFARAKLANAHASGGGAGGGALVLASMRRYEPRVLVVRAPPIAAPAAAALYPLPQARFVAVTAYQNARVTQLKIDHNPFAKGFRKEGAAASRHRHRHLPHPPTPSKRFTDFSVNSILGLT